ncbi:transglycosylase family protein [Streptomyces sp. bgisy153]|uniref:transglycosylase family protein n=1 Tax=Streptomyces sp. bgisy153 TaxID=3413793 RepID=UPI003D755E4A
MLSGNGRHRRPRQAPALLVAAGVTGSAIAIPLLGASGASAADGTVWDKVAECETGGSWSADEGNGEYGGLSLTQDDWEAYGGLAYAPSADMASRSQQIAVAQKLLAAEGIGAWGTCGLTSGLTQQNGAVSVDTGVAADSSTGGLSDSGKSSPGSPGSSGSSGKSSNADGSVHSSGSSASSPSSGSTGTPGSSSSSGSSTSAGVSGDGSGSPSDGPAAGSSAGPSGDNGASSGSSSGMAENSPESDVSASGEPGAAGGRASDGSSSIAPDGGDPDNSGQYAGTWSLVDTGSIGTGRHRGVPAEESVQGAARESGEGAADGSSYVVRDGDTLASIADSLEVTGGWHALYDGNRDVIGPDPSHIVPGQTLSVGSE